MNARATPINGQLSMLGRSDVPIFGLRTAGGDWALVDGGLAADAPLLLDQLQALVGDLARVRAWFVTHAHYDHCGAIPFLWKHMPRVRVLGSAGLARAFASDRAMGVRARLDRRAAEVRGVQLEDVERRLGGPIALSTIPVSVVADEESVRLEDGDVVRCIASPGHCDEHMSFLWAETLFAGDALGEVGRAGHHCALPLADVGGYRATLRRLAGVPASRIALGHNLVVAGSACAVLHRDAAASLDCMSRAAKRALGGGAGLDAVVAELHRSHRDASAAFLPAELHLESMRRISSLLGEEA